MAKKINWTSFSNWSFGWRVIGSLLLIVSMVLAIFFSLFQWGFALLFVALMIINNRWAEDYKTLQLKFEKLDRENYRISHEYINQLLAGSYTQHGINQWWKRQRNTLGGKTPEEVFPTNPALVANLAERDNRWGN